MSLSNKLSKVLIVDFGSQFTQLIARRIRELGVFSEIINHKKFDVRNVQEKNIMGIVLSGGPLNVYQKDKFSFDKKILNLDIPVLGICFGHQVLSKELGGKVKKSKHREFGLAEISKVSKSLLTKNFLLCVPANDNIIRLAPPLTITEDEIDNGILILEKTLKDIL